MYNSLRGQFNLTLGGVVEWFKALVFKNVSLKKFIKSPKVLLSALFNEDIKEINLRKTVVTTL